MSIQRYDFDDDGCVTDDDGIFVMFDDHAAAIAEKDAEIARLKGCLENGNCIHCGEPVSDLDVDHWRKCPKHPANAEIASLRKVVEAARDYLLAQKLDFEASQWAAHADFGNPLGPPALDRYARHARAASLHEFLADFYERRLHDALAELDTHDLDRSIDRDADIYAALAKV